ncbi:rpl18 (nucleomorph) [Hemiselmis andersenii]|uniref:Rpl18 n=1 Tax=Hemiselmis andersenii TaxID=464988 RepID=A9BKW2_HEMAN|nr:rpl18 [Hemiselmis andersenii]ABW98117.1 rpl18 [Hemiselmis andersenii]|mmetsp:Transcript_38169/g.89141  ORF Transcript_38169/g.89141 Transcript_38169/m.89141 type:complete len:147 (-) Transcript_38169:1360-1800(-)
MGGRIKKDTNKFRKSRTSAKSSNIYLSFLIKIYRFLSRRTNSKINQTILRRLVMSRKNQPAISLSRIILFGSKEKNKTIVVVGKVLNDERILMVPKISLCALRISSSAKERILNSGGNVFTFDQFAVNFPTGKNSLLLRGNKLKNK